MGYQFEAKKQWENAEKSLEYVLKVSALRDGVGSQKMVPILQHLAIVTSQQEHLAEAIGFQERVLAFAKNQSDPIPIINASVALANLYLRQQNFDKAESTIKEAYSLSQETKSLPEARKLAVAHVLGTVLRKQHRDAEAMKIDPIAATTADSKPGQPQEPKAPDQSNGKAIEQSNAKAAIRTNN
jgi:tetratricopeptide (TPR) repeat protein